MKNNNIIKIIGIPLSIHLLYSTAMLMILHFQFYYTEIPTAFDVALRIVFSLTYSIITVIFLNKFPKISIIIILAILDGIGVVFKYFKFENDMLFVNTVAIYLGVYTLIIILFSGLLAIYLNNDKSEPKSEIKTQESELKAVNLSKLLDKKRRLQNRINPCKDEARKSELQSEINEIVNEIKSRYENV